MSHISSILQFKFNRKIGLIRLVQAKSKINELGVLGHFQLYVVIFMCKKMKVQTRFRSFLQFKFVHKIRLMREKCPYSEFFRPAFSRSQTEYGDTPYLSVFSLNTGKYGPEKLRMWTLFAECKMGLLRQFGIENYT